MSSKNRATSKTHRPSLPLPNFLQHNQLAQHLYVIQSCFSLASININHSSIKLVRTSISLYLWTWQCPVIHVVFQPTKTHIFLFVTDTHESRKSRPCGHKDIQKHG